MKKQEWCLQQRASSVERLMEKLINGAGWGVILLIGAITFYLFYSGFPFIQKYGLGELLLNSRWAPVGKRVSYGISYMIGTSLFGSFGVMALIIPLGTVIALYTEELAPEWLAVIIRSAMGLMAGIPSIIYGLVGLMLVTPVFYELEKWYGKQNVDFYSVSGGANFLVSILLLTIMFLPTMVLSVGEVIRAVPEHYKLSALGLGATKFEVASGIILLCIKKQIVAAGILNFGRVLGETMVVSLVAGGIVHKPELFEPVRFLTTTLASEMGYATGAHREALFSIGLLLYLILMAVMGGMHVFTEK